MNRVQEAQGLRQRILLDSSDDHTLSILMYIRGPKHQPQDARCTSEDMTRNPRLKTQSVRKSVAYTRSYIVSDRCINPCHLTVFVV
ncbi:uncharacterized protein FOMMEDRAFT_19646 [Fomitiporia mediterranea MF3/22]|uniref:uncharacterized protein n=1 Tax=Fomitiporia mediterranea (strain MF3/22) TaxID=694068 RepID=UPI0004408416|nr:uncharacterized protein FOMMEDRAFT_19646 [Fomitiporia mediterranea MF3/22]EJD04411.1 hypothetical protein FOMMEDRAFT_19646 [Fomitiporia mediterranea MF3/22]